MKGDIFSILAYTQTFDQWDLKYAQSFAKTKDYKLRLEIDRFQS